MFLFLFVCFLICQLRERTKQSTHGSANLFFIIYGCMYINIIYHNILSWRYNHAEKEKRTNVEVIAHVMTMVHSILSHNFVVVVVVVAVQSVTRLFETWYRHAGLGRISISTSYPFFLFNTLWIVVRLPINRVCFLAFRFLLLAKAD